MQSEAPRIPELPRLDRALQTYILGTVAFEATLAQLAALVPDRGRRIAAGEEIVERCMRALHAKARELVDRKIVASEEEADLAFVFGIGFAMHLGGPLFYGTLRGWDRR